MAHRVNHRPIGRPSRFTQELQDKIVAGVRMGLAMCVASELAGVPERTFRDWMAWGRDGREPYATFAHAVEKGIAESEAQLLSTIKDASKKEWTAAAWIMERRFPERWARREALKIGLDKEAAVQAGQAIALLREKLRRMTGEEDL